MIQQDPINNNALLIDAVCNVMIYSETNLGPLFWIVKNIFLQDPTAGTLAIRMLGSKNQLCVIVSWPVFLLLEGQGNGTQNALSYLSQTTDYLKFWVHLPHPYSSKIPSLLTTFFRSKRSNSKTLAAVQSCRKIILTNKEKVPKIIYAVDP